MRGLGAHLRSGRDHGLRSWLGRWQAIAGGAVTVGARSVDYSVSQIPREKVLLGIPWYGYDWNTSTRTAGTLCRI